MTGDFQASELCQSGTTIEAGLQASKSKIDLTRNCSDGNLERKGSRLSNRVLSNKPRASPDILSDVSDGSEEIVVFGGRNQSQSRNTKKKLMPSTRQNAKDINKSSPTMDQWGRIGRSTHPTSSTLRKRDMRGKDEASRYYATCIKVDTFEDSALADYVNNIKSNYSLEDNGASTNHENKPTRSLGAESRYYRKGHEISLPRDSEADNPPYPEEWNPSVSIPRIPIQNTSLDLQGNPDFQEPLNNVNLEEAGEFGSYASIDSEDQASRPLLVEEEEEKSGVIDRAPKERDLADERVPRKLTQQEELGPGSTEVMLFDRSEDLEESAVSCSEDDALISLREEAQSYVRCGRMNKASKVKFMALPELSTDLDQYGEFDVMDRGRASLQSRKKKQARPYFELSDAELEANMLLAWDKDRSKKKARKQQREILRAQGLLGMKPGMTMKAKYHEGMTWAQIKDELKQFLKSDRQTYVLQSLLRSRRANSTPG